MATHYDMLGVPAGASAAAVRAAYLAKARALHPDRHTAEPAAARARIERAMQEINAAWTVLGDPAARRAYDESLRRVTPPPTVTVTRPMPRVTVPAPAAPDPVADEPSTFVHLLRIGPILFVLALLGAIFVFTAFAAGSHSVQSPTVSAPAGSPRVGDCVDVSPAVRVVSCAQPNDGQVKDAGQPGLVCPARTVYVRFDDTVAICVRPQP